MLTYIEGDIFSSPAQVLVNTVNTVGVMGKGIALEFKKRYPDMFREYKEQCDKHKLVIGKLMLWYAPDHWILQFPTKEHWRNPSKLEYIEKGLMVFVRKYADYNISSIAFPKLGCGNGELDWNLVKPIMEKYLKNLPIDVYIYLGRGRSSQPEHKAPSKMMNFMKENAIDLSFTGLKDNICYQTAIAPFSFEAYGSIWNAQWFPNKNLILESKEKSFVISEEDVHQLWDDICNKHIVPESNDTVDNIMFSLLTAMGYLQSITIRQEDNPVAQNGFQLDAGRGRAFLIKGDLHGI